MEKKRKLFLFAEYINVDVETYKNIYPKKFFEFMSYAGLLEFNIKCNNI